MSDIAIRVENLVKVFPSRGAGNEVRAVDGLSFNVARGSIRRNDAFNTVTSIFYFVFLFASSMFYPLDPLPPVVRILAYANPVTWQVDVFRYATIGLGRADLILLEGVAFALFTLLSFAYAVQALRTQE